MEQLVETISSTKPETLWHRDTLFQYFLTMEKLQENMKEYQELMNLAGMRIGREGVRVWGEKSWERMKVEREIWVILFDSSFSYGTVWYPRLVRRSLDVNYMYL